MPGPAPDRASARYNNPRTSDRTGRLRAAGIRISMDGRGRCMDNIFIERLRRSLKYEAVYLHEIADGFAARRVIGEWIGFYNTRESSLGAGRADAGRDLPGRHACGCVDKAQQKLREERFNAILAT